MNKILAEINKGNPVIIERNKLDEFLAYSEAQKDYYSYRLYYSEGLVRIDIVEKHTILKL